MIRKNAGTGLFLPHGDEGEKGFTLLEILVVCILLAIMLVFSLPAFRGGLLDDPLHQASRLIVGLVGEARQAAVARPLGCFLDVNFEDNSLSYVCPEEVNKELDKQKPAPRIMLPESVRIISLIRTAGKQETSGIVRLRINSRGLMEPAIINIGDDQNDMGLVCSTFLPDIHLENRVVTWKDLPQ